VVDLGVPSRDNRPMITPSPDDMRAFVTTGMNT
jgi:hypothetical protein